MSFISKQRRLNMTVPKGEVILYKDKDGEIKLDVRLEKDTVWLNQKQMGILFAKDSDTIGKHIKNIFEEGELEESPTTANFAVVQNEGDRKISRNINFYNLDVIISVGYRVKSQEGTRFRIWATSVLRDYLIKGFVMNKTVIDRRDFDAVEDTLEMIRKTIEDYKKKT